MGIENTNGFNEELKKDNGVIQEEPVKEKSPEVLNDKSDEMIQLKEQFVNRFVYLC